MRSLTRHQTVAGAFAALLLGTAPAARADLFATTEVRSPTGSNLDLATFDTATGARTDPGVNTPGNEVHPSIAGSRLVFERDTVGAIRIILRDTSTGQQADLFNGFDAASDQPNDPALTPDGTEVWTGHPLQSGQPVTLNVTHVTSFPTGPFTRNSFSTPARCTCVKSLQPLVTTTQPTLLFAVEHSDASRSLDSFDGFSGHGSILNSTGVGVGGFQHPAMAPGGSVVVFEASATPGPTGREAGLYFTSSDLTAPITELPAVVNDEVGLSTRPAFSADGRYLAFVTHDTSVDKAGHSPADSLFVWDTQTQLLIAGGISLGTLSGPLASRVLTDGNVALVSHPVLTFTGILASGAINFQLLSASGVGIIVQKVVGRTRVLGKAAPKLHFLGRVPLGRFRRGRGHIRWDRRVNGRPLGPGLYQVTVRSVTARGGVRDLGRPVLIRIKARR